jgi:hypothetical protein
MWPANGARPADRTRRQTSRRPKPSSKRARAEFLPRTADHRARNQASCVEGVRRLLWIVARRLPPEVRFVAAVLLEAAWEIFENTPFVINRYRAATISLGYFDDSVVNSMSDIGAMMVGFWTARRAPVWATVALVIVFEVMVAAIIRDNLTLNILMLIHPFEAVKRWQLGA